MKRLVSALVLTWAVGGCSGGDLAYELPEGHPARIDTSVTTLPYLEPIAPEKGEAGVSVEPTTRSAVDSGYPTSRPVMQQGGLP